MQFRCYRRTGIIDERGIESKIAGIAYRGRDTFIGVDPTDKQSGYTQVTQDVVNIGGIEYATGCLVDNDLVTLGGNFREKLGFL